MSTPATKLCPFCQLDPKRVLAEDELTVIYKDGFPFSQGHTVIIPCYQGGKEDPRGGVRWVLPEKAKHWA